MKKLSLVIPCYNEAKSLEKLTARTIDCAKRRNLTPEQFELVIVDNGSSDGTERVVEKLMTGSLRHFLKPVRVAQNQGYGFGVYSGLLAATGGTLSWTHADEQCDPEDVFIAWEVQQKKGERWLVKGTRTERALGNRIFSRGFEAVAILILNRYLPEINAQPKVFDASLMSRVTDPPYGFPFDLYVLLKAREAGWDIESIPVSFPPRAHGQSRWAATFRSKFRTIWGMVQFMWAYRLNPSSALTPGREPTQIDSAQNPKSSQATTRERNVG